MLDCLGPNVSFLTRLVRPAALLVVLVSALDLRADDSDDDEDLDLTAPAREPALLKQPAQQPAQAASDVGLSVPEGFSVTQFADDALAHDIFSMTIDSLGRVV